LDKIFEQIWLNTTSTHAHLYSLSVPLINRAQKIYKKRSPFHNTAI